MPDTFTEAQSPKQPEGTLTWAAHNIFDPALNAGPLGIWNTVADLTHLPECHLTVDQAKAYSPEWFVQGFSAGVGIAVPLMLAAAGTSKVFKGADRLLAGTKFGEIASPLLTSSRAAKIIGASAYGASQKPDQNHTRFGVAAGMALGFLAFDRGNMISAPLSLWGKALAYPATGLAGGFLMSEGAQLLSNGKLANGDQALQSAVQGMTLNTIMPLAQAGISRLAAGQEGIGAGSNRVASRAEHAIAQRANFVASDDDPGKDITPDPHGSDPHGETHDGSLPANNPPVIVWPWDPPKYSWGSA